MKAKTVFFCSECGQESLRWLGKCPACDSWNTMVEQPAPSKTASAPLKGAFSGARPVAISDIVTGDEPRFSTGLSELDRVLGGGMVNGSLVLVGGEPGMGKSTLLLQICKYLCEKLRVLYVSGEESGHQLKLRAQRLNVDSKELFILSETNMQDILEAVSSLAPQILIIDSIQTMYSDSMSTAPGNVGQVKECTLSFMRLAKGQGITVFIIGHVNKEGAIAGPKVLEHMVDCVLYFEGDRHMSYRILRAAKNRYGSTNEIGVFEMGDAGLIEVPNPSEMLLAGRPQDVPGTCVACIMEGSRPMLAEVQALITPTSFGTPRRMTAGIDYNRAMLLLAVLEKRSGMFVGNCDAYINVIGGIKMDEPAADLPTILAVASSFKDKPIEGSLAAFGEVGLAGELRAVTAALPRLSEMLRLGFTKCILPKQGASRLKVPDGLEAVFVRDLREALQVVFG